MIVGPIIVAIIFILLIIASPFVFKGVLKMESFFGYAKGACCSILTALVIAAGIIIAFIIYVVKIVDSIDKNGGNTDAQEVLEVAGVGLLLVLLVVFIIIYLAVFFLLWCYTRRISDPQYPMNTVFMFISGYSALSFIFCYVMIIILCLATDEVNNQAGGGETTSSAISSFYILLCFIVFGFLLRCAGIAVMFMIFHRGLGKIMPLIAAGVFFGPIIFFLIGVLAKVLSLLEYPVFIFDVASIVLGIFFYIRYSNQTASTDGMMMSSGETATEEMRN